LSIYFTVNLFFNAKPHNVLLVFLTFVTSDIKSLQQRA